MMRANSRQTDQNVKVPSAVLAQVARANELMGIEETVLPIEAPVETPPTEEPVPEPAVEAQPEPASEPAPEPAPEAPPTSPLAAEAKPEPAATEMEQKFRSEQGRRKKLEGDYNNLQTEVTNLRRVIAKLESLPAAVPAAAAPLFQPEALTSDEIESYGADFIKVVKKAAGSEIAGAVQGLVNKVSQLEQKLTGVETKSEILDRQALHETLDRRIPNWVELNRNPDFIAWVERPDPLSGQIRLQLLEQAYNSNDASRVAASFESFLREVNTVAPRDEPEPASGRAPAPARTLESLASPGRAKAGVAPVIAEKPIFSRAEIARFYADVSAKRFRGREAEKERIEAQIFEAERDGRIQ